MFHAYIERCSAINLVNARIMYKCSERLWCAFKATIEGMHGGSINKILGEELGKIYENSRRTPTKLRKKIGSSEGIMKIKTASCSSPASSGRPKGDVVMARSALSFI